MNIVKALRSCSGFRSAMGYRIDATCDGFVQENYSLLWLPNMPDADWSIFTSTVSTRR
jgi:hypothetical protein